MEIGRLTREDVPAAMGLSRQAGWNQVPADWHRLLDLAREGCFAGRVDGELVATATLVTYAGAVGWIGMVLVDEAHRRNGYGTAMFERALRAADERGVAVGLDATDAGREVYRPAGFADVRPIVRWGGTPSRAASEETAGDGATSDEATGDAEGDSGSDAEAGPDADVRRLRAGEVDAVRALDRRACGVDRGALLEHLLSSDGVTGLALGDGPRGYAVVRPGREHDHVGPVVAPSAAGVAALVAAAGGVVGGSVLIDVLAGDRVADRLELLGLAPRRRLTRMSYPDRERLLVGDDVAAAAGFELG